MQPEPLAEVPRKLCSQMKALLMPRSTAEPTFPIQQVDSNSQTIHKVAAGARVPCCSFQVCEMTQGLLVGKLHGLLHRDEGVLVVVALCSHLLLQRVVGVCTDQSQMQPGQPSTAVQPS